MLTNELKHKYKLFIIKRKLLSISKIFKKK